MVARLGTRRGLMADLDGPPRGPGNLPSFMGARLVRSRNMGGLAVVSKCRVVLWVANWTRLVLNSVLARCCEADCFARSADRRNRAAMPPVVEGFSWWFLSTARLILLLLLPFAIAVRASSALISARASSVSSAAVC